MLPVAAARVRLHMMARTVLLALCLLLCDRVPAFPKGSVVPKEDTWNPHHISGLPIEVQQYIASICKGPPSAMHECATYFPPEHRWRINLEYLQCKGLGQYRYGNQCLDVDFVEVGSRVRLTSKQYRGCGF
jgi:hypothetical protein